MSKKVKTFAIVVLIIAAIIFAVSFFSGSDDSSSSNSLLNSSVVPAAGLPMGNNIPASTEFSSMLSTISTITIDTTIFEDSVFRSLRDSPITLGSDIKGRPNPFAPVGNDVGTIGGLMPVSATSSNVQFETLQPIKVTATTAEFGAQAMLSSTAGAQVIFEYGDSILYGKATSPISLSSNGTALMRVTELNPQTTYYVRAVLTQGSNTTAGNQMTFTTSSTAR